MKTEERHAYLDLCIPYVFGRLNPGNRRQFEAHVATGCEPCTKELAELHEAMALLPLLLKQQAPPSGVRGRILARATAGKAERPTIAKPVAEAFAKEQGRRLSARSPKRWYSYALVVFSVLIVIALAMFVGELRNTIGGQERRIVELQGELQRKGEIQNVLLSDRLEMVLLNSLDTSQAAKGKIFWDPSGKNALLQTANLPLTPSNKEYQLWAVKGGKILRGGTFVVLNDKEKESLFKVIGLATGERQDIDGFALTLEPTGGSTQPTGPVYLRSASK